MEKRAKPDGSRSRLSDLRNEQLKSKIDLGEPFGRPMPRPEDSLEGLVLLYRPYIIPSDRTRAEREGDLQRHTLSRDALWHLQQRLGGDRFIPQVVTLWTLLLAGIKASKGEIDQARAGVLWQRVTEGTAKEKIRPTLGVGKRHVERELEVVAGEVLLRAMGVTPPTR